jgi:hypothetical protein
VNTGEAIVAVGARPSHGEAMVAGDVVNTAARLQAAAPVHGILVGEETYAGTRAMIEYEPVEPVAAKGKTLPVRAWLALGPRGAVGERSSVEERRPHLVTVFGPTGIGKSRLAHELTQRAAASGGLVLRGRSLP